MSNLKLSNIQNQDGSKTIPTETVIGGTPKAWVNFNGTGTVAIRRAFNVLSVTDNSTGNWTVNFTNPLPDGNYAFSVSGPLNSAGDGRVTYGGAWIAATGVNKVMTSSQLKVMAYLLATDVLYDSETVSVAIFS